MNRSLFWLAALLGAGTLGCDDKDDGIEGEESDADADADSDADTDADSDADTDADPVFEPAAIGFEYVGGWDEGADELTGWTYEGKPAENYVIMTITDIDYFDAETAEDQEGHYCELFAVFHNEPAVGFQAQAYETGEDLEVWAAYEGWLEITGYDPKQTACTNVDTEAWPDINGDKIPDIWAPFQYMHFGIGFGPLTEYASSAWSEKTIKEYGDFMMTEYIAVNHPDGTGGYTFIGYDWNTAFLWQWDPKTREVLVDEEDKLIGQNVGDPVLQGFVASYPYWYEDYPNLDFTILAEGGGKPKKK